MIPLLVIASDRMVARQSRFGADWIASSLALLAMTGEVAERVEGWMLNQVQHDAARNDRICEESQ